MLDNGIFVMGAPVIGMADSSPGRLETGLLDAGTPVGVVPIMPNGACILYIPLGLDPLGINDPIP